MTWSEIKQAVEAAGITDGDEILGIECEQCGGKRFHVVQIGPVLELQEDAAEDARGATRPRLEPAPAARPGPATTKGVAARPAPEWDARSAARDHVHRHL